VSDVVSWAASPSGKYIANLREVSGDTKDEKKRFVEVWRDGRLEVQCEVTDTHKSFYADGASSSP
jgi:hypothetical protein